MVITALLSWSKDGDELERIEDTSPSSLTVTDRLTKTWNSIRRRSAPDLESKGCWMWSIRSVEGRGCYCYGPRQLRRLKLREENGLRVQASEKCKRFNNDSRHSSDWSAQWVDSAMSTEYCYLWKWEKGTMNNVIPWQCLLLIRITFYSFLLQSPSTLSTSMHACRVKKLRSRNSRGNWEYEFLFRSYQTLYIIIMKAPQHHRRMSWSLRRT